jgi:hypothetical protein
MKLKLKASNNIQYAFLPEENKICVRDNMCVIDYLQFELSKIQMYNKESIMDLTFKNFFKL